jgi:hypothetical protein
MTTGYALIDTRGRVQGTTREWNSDPALMPVPLWSTFLQIESAPAEWGVINWQFVHTPPPKPWYVWHNNDWHYEAQAHADYLVYAKDAMWEKIRLYRDARSEQGFPAAGKWWHNDNISRGRILGLMVMLMAGGGTLPQGIVFKTMSGDLVVLTAQIAQLMFSGAATQDVWMFAVAEQHRMAMEACEDPFTYVYTTGWPPVYGE